MSATKVLHALLPLLVFLSLSALGFKFIYQNNPVLEANVKPYCHPDKPSRYLLPYTGLAGLDATLCVFVTVFHAAMTPEVTPFLRYFLSAVGPPVSIIMAVDGARRNQHWSVSYPVVVGLIYQVATFGVTMPIYWLLFILSGAASRRGGDPALSNKITEADAHAIIFGFISGGALPTAAMLLLDDPYVTAIWQLFPLWMSLAQQLHLIIKPAFRHPETGYNAIKMLYIAVFITSSSLHIATVFPLLVGTGPQSVLSFFAPSTKPLPMSGSFPLAVLDLLQWDMLLGMSASLLASLWFARNVKHVAGILAWYMISVPLAGPGAAFAAVALWRESYMNQLPKPVAKTKTR